MCTCHRVSFHLKSGPGVPSCFIPRPHVTGSVFCSEIVMVSLSTCSWPEEAPPASVALSPGRHTAPSRSRSPPPSSGNVVTAAQRGPSVAQSVSGHSHGQAAPPTGIAPWTTGDPSCDAWLRHNCPDVQVLNDFTELPQRNRKAIVLNAMDKPKDNLVKWLAACINNHRKREQEKRLLSSLHFVT